MNLVTIDQARQHCKADGDDDMHLTVCVNAAEAHCARIANRNLYKSTADLTAAVALIPQKTADAYTAYDAAMAALPSDYRLAAHSAAFARGQLSAVLNAQTDVANGLALDSLPDLGQSIRMAVLLATDHFYRNRASVETGQGAAAVEVPMTTRNIMEFYRVIAGDKA